MELIPIVVNVLNANLEVERKLHFNTKDGPKVFPVDSILDFQKKISVVSGIEFYKQCLCTEWLPITHKALLYSKTVDMDIRDIKKTSSMISNINIDILFYENKADIVIVSTISTLIRDIVTKPCEFNLFVMDLFINENLLNLNVETYQELYFYGCVYKYWPFLSFDAFKIYISQPDEFKNMYPLLNMTIDDIKYQYDEETRLIRDIKIQHVDFFNHVSHDDLSLRINSVKLVNPNNKNRYDLRILFDLIYINNSIELIYLKTQFNDESINIFKTKTVSDPLKIESYIEMIKDDDDDNCMYIIYDTQNINISLKITQNNSHEVVCKILNNNNYSVNDVIKMCKQTIKHEFNEVSSVFNEINQNDAFIIETISVFLIWDKTIDMDVYLMIPQYYNDMIRLSIVESIPSEKNYYQFVFHKGMTKNEGFQKFTSMVAMNASAPSGQKVNIHYMFNQIKFELINITPANFDVVYGFIVHFTNDFVKKYNVGKVQRHDNSLLLKSLDYELYNGLIGDKLYSRICQKKYQPIMRLHVDDPHSYTQYYNFTSKTPVYYSCPNPEYPHFSFITGIHSQNYCVPCCKKKANFNRTIHNDCLKNHVFIESPDIIKKSRYIINFGKHIDNKRLRHLPSIMSQYFNDASYSDQYETEFPFNGKNWSIYSFITRKTTMVDITPFKDALPQHMHHAIENPDSNVYLHNLIKRLIIHPLILGPDSQLLWHNLMVAKYVMNNATSVPVIKLSSRDLLPATLGGIDDDGLFMYGNSQYYNNMNTSVFYCIALHENKEIDELFADIVSKLRSDAVVKEIFSTKYNCDIVQEFASIREKQSNINWNKIAIDIAYYFYNIYVIVFYYKDNILRVKIPTKKQGEREFMLLYKNIECLKNDIKLILYYIIGFFVLKNYFKTQEIEKTTFDSTSKVYSTVKSLINYLHINNDESLFFTFLKMNGCTVEKYYTNKHGFHYMCLINWNDQKILFPIFFQLKSSDNKVESYSRHSATVTVSQLKKFLEMFNEYLLGNNVISTIFEVQGYLRYKGELIGLVSKGLHFYFKDPAHQATNVIDLKYDPDDLNKVIISAASDTNIFKDLPKHYYKNYLYYLFCIQVVFSVNLKKISTVDDLKPYFQIESDILIKEFPNIMLSCLSKMPYCRETKMLISKKDFDYYSELFIKELPKIHINKLLPFMINNYFKFNRRDGESIYIEGN
jgi:hypothetical protein